MPTPLLTACVLLPGNPDTLQHIVSTLSSIPDEILAVCDDPPSPAFKSAASRLGVTLVPHAWQKSFAAARNAALAAARSDWIFFIDSDETLLAPTPAEFRALLTAPDILGYYVTIEDHIDPQSPMSPRQHRSLFRRLPQIRYTGRVHEQHHPSLEDLAAALCLRMSPSPIRLSHTGYQPAERLAKLHRNIALLDLELHDRPNQLYYLIELGRSLLLTSQPRGHTVLATAATLLLPSSKNPTPPIPLVAALLEYALQHAPPAFPISSIHAIALAERWFPDSPPLLWCIARCYYKSNQPHLAAPILERILSLAASQQYDTTISFDQRLFGDETRLNLGVCYAKLNQPTQALHHFHLITPQSPFFAMAQQNIHYLTP